MKYSNSEILQEFSDIEGVPEQFQRLELLQKISGNDQSLTEAFIDFQLLDPKVQDFVMKDVNEPKGLSKAESQRLLANPTEVFFEKEYRQDEPAS